ncbi:MAG: 3-demethylubiquinone-9 3-methyltransferase [Gammaproteobacteria bacterium SG8_47]|nr:MAG: 3-demethylubiquinone-9 3-methyltransferase [Gammaproteobacteria bacterium SG8_47]
MSELHSNVDAHEVAKFDAQASRWWDPQGEFKTLHDINPLRLEYIERLVGLAGKDVLDVGCGGGVLSEAMARAGAKVTGIDMGEGPLSVAKLHRLESGVDVNYERSTAEAYAAARPEHFDVVTCMELLEHVPDPASVVASCAASVRPGGYVFFSTLNRNPKSYLFAIVGAEYMLRMLTPGTHDFSKFIRPAELERWTRAAGLSMLDISGMTYNPFTKAYRLSRDLDVNYLVACQKPA